MIVLNHKLEKYDVEIYLYDDSGKLVDQREYKGLTQIVLKTGEVRISKQLIGNPLTIIAYASKPRVELRENTLLYIVDEGSC